MTVVQDPPAGGAVATVIRVGRPRSSVFKSRRSLDPDVGWTSSSVRRASRVYRPELERLNASGSRRDHGDGDLVEDFGERRVIGVTGSKGKTMTALVDGAGPRSSGLSVGLGGNIGTPVTDFYAGRSKDAYVIEVSSFRPPRSRSRRRSESSPFCRLTTWTGTAATRDTCRTS